MNIHFKKVLAGAVMIAGLAAAGLALAGNINTGTTDHYAWTNVTGWIDFDSSVTVSATKLTGNPSSTQIGSISLDCTNTPNGNICGGPAGSWWVANDGNGNLSGWAWSDAIGWISFCGNASAGSGATGGCPGSPTYQVKIDTTNGDFSGFAWNDVVGWIGFNCHDSEGITCAHDYKVATSFTAGPTPPNGFGPGGFDSNTWLISRVFDTRVTGGAAFNTITWQGNQPAGTAVGFQIATSNNAAGPWNYYGPSGDGTTVYSPNVNTQAKIARKFHNNFQYVRYRAYLLWAGSSSPRVDDVIISYSP
jgi:hypothetical protein